MTKALILTFASTLSLGLAADVELSLTIKRDTLLPLEPIYALVVARNVASEPVSIPHIREGYSNTTFAYSVYSPSDRQVFRSRSLSFPEPSWSDHVLAPGDSACAVFDVGGAYFEPGAYTVRLRWNSTVRGAVPAWATAKLCTASFTIRKPDSAEQRALDAFSRFTRYNSGSYWFGSEGQHLKSGRERILDRWLKAEPLARRMIAEREAEPYVVLAGTELMVDYWNRSVGMTYALPAYQSPEQWRDSLRSLNRQMLFGYPDSPILEHCVLSQGIHQTDADGPDAPLNLLTELACRLPDTRVGRAAVCMLKLQGRMQDR